MNWNRRDFLKAGGLTSLALGLNAFSPAMFKRRILAAPPSPKKIIFVFQRGGNDGINTVIPRGDPEYSVTNRPTLFIDQADAIDLGNGFAQLHPMMQPMMEIYNHTTLNGVAGPGNLAIIHRVGYSGQSQSHFDSQQYWENGTPGQPYYEEGILYRHVAETLDPTNNHFVAASMSSSQMVALKGSIPIPTVSNPATFSFSGSAAKVQKFLGSLPTAPVGPDGKGMLGFYGGPRDFAGKPYRDLVYGTGLVLADAVSIVQDAVAVGPYTPENGAVYPSGGFGDKLKNVAMLLKRTPVQILGVNIGGWDTHTGQGSVYGYHGNLLGSVAQGFQALYRDLQAQWDDVVIFTMSEFGRTSKENGSFGTDHAYANVVFCAGGGVNGGVYNCDTTTWAAGAMFSTPTSNPRYLRHTTDFRSIYEQILRGHALDSQQVIERVIPNINQLKADKPNEFKDLGLFS